jgi:hypothetical protein
MQYSILKICFKKCFQNILEKANFPWNILKKDSILASVRRDELSSLSTHIFKILY